MIGAGCWNRRSDTGAGKLIEPKADWLELWAPRPNPSESPLAIERMRKAAQDRLTSAAKLPAGQPESSVDAARREHASALAEWARLDAERIRIEVTIPLSEKMLAQLQGELPGISFSKSEAESPICPICEVPIDRAIAEKCGLSNKLPDLEACRQRWELRKQSFDDENNRLTTLRSDKTRTLQQLALAKQRVDQSAQSLAAIEKARDTREGAWYSARRLVDDVERLSELIGAQQDDLSSAREMGSLLERERGLLGAFRDKQARVFGRLSEKFDPIVRRLVGLGRQGTRHFERQRT